MIQVVYDKIVNFCGVTKISCVIVGSKSDLYISYVVSFFLRKKRRAVIFFFSSVFFFCLFLFVLGFFFKKKNSPYLSRQVSESEGDKLAKLNDCAWIETSAKNNLNIRAFNPFIHLSHTTRFFIFLNLGS